MQTDGMQGVDVQGELTAARSAIEQLGKQVALLQRDQEVRVGRHSSCACWILCKAAMQCP